MKFYIFDKSEIIYKNNLKFIALPIFIANGTIHKNDIVNIPLVNGEYIERTVIDFGTFGNITEFQCGEVTNILIEYIEQSKIKVTPIESFIIANNYGTSIEIIENCNSFRNSKIILFSYLRNELALRLWYESLIYDIVFLNPDTQYPNFNESKISFIKVFKSDKLLICTIHLKNNNDFIIKCDNTKVLKYDD